MTLEHLQACWPRTYLNAATHTVCAWTGWGFDEVLDHLTAFADGVVMHMRRPERDGSPAVYRSGEHKGKPLHFWTKPDGAHGLPPVEDPRLALVGISRAMPHGRNVIYEGARPLEVYRRARCSGFRVDGYSLDWQGPDPVVRPQVELPLGVLL